MPVGNGWPYLPGKGNPSISFVVLFDNCLRMCYIIIVDIVIISDNDVDFGQLVPGAARDFQQGCCAKTVSHTKDFHSEIRQRRPDYLAGNKEGLITA